MNSWNELIAYMAADLRSKTKAVHYVESLRSASNDNVDRAVELITEVTQKKWGPLMRGFVKWVVETTDKNSALIFLLRDAGSAYKIASLTASQHRRTCIPLYLSRAMLGLPDEMSKNNPSAKQKLLKRYLKFFSDHEIVLVDTGCWGGIVAELYKTFGYRCQTRLLFSHNPWIPSYLSHLGLPEQIGEVLNDSLEVAYPNKYHRVTQLMVLGKEVVPIRSPRKTLILAIYTGTTVGLEMSCDPVDEYELVRSLVECHINARDKNIWTGVLPVKSVMLESSPSVIWTYPEELKTVNPIELLPAGYQPNRRMVDLSGLPIQL